MRVTTMGELHLNLGLRGVARRTALSLSEMTGLTVISVKTRDKILDSAPWLAGYFQMTERVRRLDGNHPAAPDPYLRFDNPYLAELRRRYAGQPASDHIQWGTSAVESRVDLPFFRADNLYVFQSRRYPPLALYASAAYVTQVDRLGLFNALAEDDLFGAELFDFHGKTVSRDLLDSIIELNFLDRHLNLASGRALNVLDIGAGYGRLAHRMVTAFPNVKKYYCVDAVPESTFISDYYLRFRKMTERCTVVPLDRLNQVERVDLAVNIHSFAECRNRVVGWWLDQVREMRIPWLFIATTASLGLTSHEDRGRKDYREIIERAGFALAVHERKFESAPVLQDHGLYPADYYLFQKK
jgi:hypothetical protein